MHPFWILISLSTLSAMAYGMHFVHQGQSLHRSLCKFLPIGALTLLSFYSGAPVALSLALLFGTLGDVFLSRDGDRFFLLGLGAFLIGHLCYIAVLAGLSLGPDALMEPSWRILAGVILVGIAAWMVRKLLPHLGPLRLPVLVYVAVIVAMGLTALTAPLDWPLTLAVIGAALFTASDAILGLELFVHKDDPTPRPTQATLLWFLYWSGQCLILFAVLPL